MDTLRRYRHYIGVLFDRGERWRLVFSVLCSFALALMDTASVLLIAPLVLAMGSTWNSGAAGMVARALGITDQTTLVLVLLCASVGGFVLKDLLTIAYSWWSSSFMARIRAEAQIAMTENYMRLPYHRHADLGLATVLRKTITSVTQAYVTFTRGLLEALQQFLTASSSPRPSSSPPR